MTMLPVSVLLPVHNGAAGQRAILDRGICWSLYDSGVEFIEAGSLPRLAAEQMRRSMLDKKCLQYILHDDFNCPQFLK